MKPFAPSALLALLLLSLLGGCTNPEPTPPEPVPVQPCDGATPREVVLYLGPDRTLVPELPAAGVERSDGFAEGFLTNDAQAWRSAEARNATRIVGNATLEFWYASTGLPGYPALTTTDAFRFFNQFGTDKFPAAATTPYYSPLVEVPGEVMHVTQQLTLPEGGLRVEANDTVSLLLAGLSPMGEEVHYGGDTPSALRFTVECVPDQEWTLLRYLRFPVNLPGNQGGPTGRIPATEGVNTLSVPFTLENGTERLRVFLRSDVAGRPPKDDMDIRLMRGAELVIDPSTPFTDELLVLWQENLAALAPPGPYTLRIDSYSGVQYSGLLEIALEEGTDPAEA